MLYGVPRKEGLTVLTCAAISCILGMGVTHSVFVSYEKSKKRNLPDNEAKQELK
ncbi:hypothetical protein MACJ_003947 [Theileria orientalis]|uniref:Uncharacterized protein n=1 Tax=Theileria orientalis TaxID=68886 RepID=A0A976SKR7_THEOR|nr:hypothetical protein MACJ_003947 [Theileria orientalis]